MNSTTGTPKNMLTLEQLLSTLRDQAKIDYPVLVSALSEAVMICQSTRAVHTGINTHLQLALASLRAGSPDDATPHVEDALDIEDRWNGRVTEGFESIGEFPQLNKTAEGWSRTLRVIRAEPIAARLLMLPVVVVVFAANTIARALMLASRPFAYVAERGNTLHGALLRELGWPS